ncbi:type III-B CRISPR module RAMP protein Cmr1 [Bacillus altitudinis]|uniref:type III-B CRISPR module RAMP protein Cmr1 n=1 Tax=Bacillus altitudinis TaxID=293387 RepID=UPI001567D6EE|nr:type III-B CRISPR module RAMP protein Cmr1 [Bacillus altitudinis]QKJ39421.1 type III-B CRISPR module RAMP protein Cmr1 [Bacillus altitudinis]UTX09745.1 type III-B CRISPR module RAMP protein Cmr1 [Bacillus altitudinis]
MTRESSKPKTNWHDVKHAIDTKIHEDQRLFKEPLTIHLVTPMFGGGPQSNSIDQDRPIRESAIRGHLRFWWRATRGAACKNANELSKREAEIFGHTEKSSLIKVIVEEIFKEQKQIKFPPKFIFQKTPNKMLMGYFKMNVYLTESASMTSQDKKKLGNEIEAALWAWINFGGLGARTRRGCGSLYCETFSPKEQEVSKERFDQWFKEKVCQYAISIPEVPREWATLSWEFRLQNKASQTHVSWTRTMDTYIKFRKKHNIQNGEAGRSYWPEADSIRHLANMSHPDHELPYPSNKPKGYIAFPRAQFGMPIVFNFKKKSKKDKERSEEEIAKRKWFQKEPNTKTLVPRNKNRLASPLILKPLAINQKESVGMVMVLQQPKIEALSLLGDRKPLPDVTDEQSIYPTATYSNNPLQDESGRTHSSAIQAFLHSKEVRTFCQKNYKNKH